jgi:hypothetical protein
MRQRDPPEAGQDWVGVIGFPVGAQTLAAFWAVKRSYVKEGVQL